MDNEAIRMQNKYAARLPTRTGLLKQGLLKEGPAAIKEAEKIKGAPLTEVEKEIVLREGYSPVPYRDDKGIPTIGFGQTGEFMTKSFSDVLSKKEKEITRYFPDYDKLDEGLKATLMGLYYRGDVKKNYKWVKEFNKGNYVAAAGNLLDNDEYRRREEESLKTGKGDGVVNRFRDAYSKFLEYDPNLKKVSSSTDNPQTFAQSDDPFVRMAEQSSQGNYSQPMASLYPEDPFMNPLFFNPNNLAA